MQKISLILIAAVGMLFGCKSGTDELKSPGGYAYTLHKNTGGAKPQVGDIVFFHMTQRNGDSIMYSTYERGQEEISRISEGKSTNPIEDIIKLLAVGDSVTIPYQIDTVPNLPPNLQGIKTLFFDLVVTKIQTAADQKAEEEKFKAKEGEVKTMVADILAKYKSNGFGADLKTTPEGLKYVIHEAGTGAKAQPGNTVIVNYYGVLTSDGSMFDNSFGRGQGFAFVLGQGQVIPGWDIGIGLLNEGGKATLFIPAGMAYGEAGSPPVIPPNAELAFYVELVKVQ